MKKTTLFLILLSWTLSLSKLNESSAERMSMRTFEAPESLSLLWSIS